MKIGSYLPSAILISVSLMFGGLRGYVMSAWTRAPQSLEWTKQSRPVLRTILFIIATHTGGVASFLYLSLPGFVSIFLSNVTLSSTVYSLASLLG
jgi:glycosylphosphatidylinositol transamidase